MEWGLSSSHLTTPPDFDARMALTPPAVGTLVRVRLRHLMTSPTMASSGPESAIEVLAIRHALQVRRIAAGPNSAEMVYNESTISRRVPMFSAERDHVSPFVDTFLPDNAVATGVDSSLEDPTPTLVNVDTKQNAVKKKRVWRQLTETAARVRTEAREPT